MRPSTYGSASTKISEAARPDAPFPGVVQVLIPETTTASPNTQRDRRGGAKAPIP